MSKDKQFKRGDKVRIMEGNRIERVAEVNDDGVLVQFPGYKYFKPEELEIVSRAGFWYNLVHWWRGIDWNLVKTAAVFWLIFLSFISFAFVGIIASLKSFL